MSEQLKQEMIRVGQKLYDRQLLVATEGNLSCRLPGDRILATPSGLCKGELTSADLVIIDGRGNHLEGERRVSSEILMHLEVYRLRPDVQAVVHAHPPICIALMLAGKNLDRPILAENILLMGKVPVAEYARPSTPAVAESIRPWVPRTDFVLLDRHGSLTMGETLAEAFFRLETMEHTARSYAQALQLGDVREFERAEIEALMDLREKRYKLKGRVIPFID